MEKREETTEGPFAEEGLVARLLSWDILGVVSFLFLIYLAALLLIPKKHN